MRGRANVVCLALVACVAALAAACGGSSQATGPEAVAASGNAVLQGSVQGATSELRVSVVGTSLSAPVDEDGQFLMSSVPSGSVTLRFEGAGADAKLTVDGLRDGQVTSIAVSLGGGSAQLTSPPSCAQTASTFFSGTLDQASASRLVVSGRTVDTSQLQKVWRGGRRVELSDIQPGEKVRVWGVLHGDGVVMADEIECLSGGGEGETWTSFSGKVESVGGGAFAGLGLHADPNRNKTFVVAGRTVKTDGGTSFVWSDRSPLDPNDVMPGQKAYVEGWKNTEGTVRATTFKLEGSGGGKPVPVRFRGRVESVVASGRGGSLVHLDNDVNASCNLDLVIAGRKVKSDGSTVYRWSDGTELDYTQIVVGDMASVDGYAQTAGYVQATRLVIDKR